MTSRLAGFVAALGLVGLTATPAHASSIVIGNASPGFAAGSQPGSATVSSAQAGSPAPFNALCGADVAGPNCSATYTFNYALAPGDTVTGASLTLGIHDIDSKATGLQVQNFSISGGDNLTLLLNTAAEALNGGAGAKQNEYDVFTFSLLNLVPLNSGSVTVNLLLKAPGGGVLGDTTFNGASLIYSQLDLTTQSGGDPNPAPVPEPSSLLLLTGGMAFLARARAKPRA